MTARWLLIAALLLSLVFAQDDDAFGGGAIVPERAVTVFVEAASIGFQYEGVPEGASVVLEAITTYAFTFNNISEQPQTLDIRRVSGLDGAQISGDELIPSLILKPGASQTLRLTLSEEQKGIWQVSTGTGSSWLIIN